MSERSNPAYYTTMPTAAFNADEPLSTLRSWHLMNNAQHLIDSSPQYRVNWGIATDASGIEYTTDDGTTPVYAAWEFPITMVRRENMPNFDIRVASICGSGVTDALITAALAPITSRPERTGAANDQQIFRYTSTATATAIGWTIDTQYEWSGPNNSYLDSRRGFAVTESSLKEPVQIVMARLEITVLGNGGTVRVCSVQLREYV